MEIRFLVHQNGRIDCCLHRGVAPPAGECRDFTKNGPGSKRIQPVATVDFTGEDIECSAGNEIDFMTSFPFPDSDVPGRKPSVDESISQSSQVFVRNIAEDRRGPQKR